MGSLFGSASSYGGGYRSAYGGGYGSYSSYGSYGSYGGGMYGSGAYGSNALPLNGQSHAPNALQSGFHLVHQTTEVFGRLSYLLGASFDSIRSSLASLIGLYEGLWPMLTAVQGLALFRLLRALHRKLSALLSWILGRSSTASTPASTATSTTPTTAGSSWERTFAEDEARDTRPAPLVLRVAVALALFVAAPYAAYRGYKALASLWQQPSQQQHQQQQAGGVAAVFRAKHTFDTADEGELPFRAGEAVRVLDPHAVPGQQAWAVAEVAGRRGLVPLNYLTTL